MLSAPGPGGLPSPGQVVGRRHRAKSPQAQPFHHIRASKLAPVPARHGSAGSEPAPARRTVRRRREHLRHGLARHRQILTDISSRPWHHEFEGVVPLQEAATAVESIESDVTGVSRAMQLVQALVNTHQTALTAQKRRKSIVDPYGNEVVRGWQKELDYFYERVVHPTILARLPARRLRRPHRCV